MQFSSNDYFRFRLQAVVSKLGIHRLYEQKQTAPEGAVILDDYLTRWVYGGLAPLNGALTADSKTQQTQPHQE
jgi:hypothetical protein